MPTPRPARSRPAAPAARPLWRCAACGRRFANRNQTHTCAPLELEHHFARRAPEVRALFDAFVALVRDIGPVRVLPQKTRIAFQTRMSFAQLTPRADGFAGHLVLAERVDDPRITRIVTYSPRNHTHEFRIRSPRDLDAGLRRLVEMAYRVGEQKHLELRRRAARDRA